MASSLAYGRVQQIVKNTVAVLNAMGPSPRKYMERATPGRMQKDYQGFKYRFTTEHELLAMLMSARTMVREHGGLDQCMARELEQARGVYEDALAGFAASLNMQADCGRSSLMPRPECGSACKRLNLFLRWMVRRDEVDPGGWTSVKPAQLIIPLDTHMHRICTAMGLTTRKSADMRTALEITDAFRSIAPRDPVKYDFAITRLGIRHDMNEDQFLKDYWNQGAA
jgi:uncharacterized protein (TIGR02757 family)